MFDRYNMTEEQRAYWTAKREAETKALAESALARAHIMEGDVLQRWLKSHRYVFPETCAAIDAALVAGRPVFWSWSEEGGRWEAPMRETIEQAAHDAAQIIGQYVLGAR